MGLIKSKKIRLEDIPLILFWICVTWYVIDVVLGKFGAVEAGFRSPLQLGDAGQFLLLLAASAFLVVAALLREARRKTK